MTTKELILQRLDLASESVLQEILQLLNDHTSPEKGQWSPDFFERTVGGWAGEPLERAPQETQPERKAFE